MSRGCDVPGCERLHHARGYCGPHAHRARRHGDPLGGGTERTRDLARRIARWLLVGDGCWLWTGAHDQDGYGQLSIGGGVITRVHRVVYELFVGPIPDGLEPDHLCRTPACARPDHLEPVTHRENIRRGYAAKAARRAEAA